MELVRAVASARSASSKSIAILANQESYTYHQLISSAQKISNLADGYRENKCLGGSRIGIVVKPYAEFVAGVLGTWFSGGVAVPFALSYPEAELLHVMNDSVTKESFIDDGFFKTGDCARMDEDGYYVILGRTNADIMKAGGYKLSALEIEAVLLEHPAIEECCALGLPDND